MTLLWATGDALVFTPNLKFHIYWLFLTCNLGTWITYLESYEQSLYSLYPPPPAPGDERGSSRGLDDLLARPASPGLYDGSSQGHKEECGALASRQRWHFALAVTTGKAALAPITARSLGRHAFSLC